MYATEKPFPACGATGNGKDKRSVGSLALQLHSTTGQEKKQGGGPLVFSEIRERVTAEEVARFYGMELDRRGKKALCPFHSDRHPSLSFYKGGFKCFACGASGSSLDLTMQLLGLDIKGAALRLNEDFRLGLTLDREPTAAERETARKVHDARQLFTTWREETLNRLDAVIRMANTAALDDMTDTEALALKYRDSFEYWADVLQHAPLSEQMTIFRDRKEVDRLCLTILKSMPTRSRTA